MCGVIGKGHDMESTHLKPLTRYGDGPAKAQFVPELPPIFMMTAFEAWLYDLGLLKLGFSTTAATSKKPGATPTT